MIHIWLALRLTLAGVFLVAGLAKSRAFEHAVKTWSDLLRQIGLPTRRWARVAAALLIATETAIGVAMLIGGRVVVPAYVAAGLLLAGFTVLALLSASHTVDLHCACFGRVTARLGWRHVWRNVVLLSIAATGLAAATQNTAGQWDPGGVAVAVAAATVATIVAAFYDDIADIIGDHAIG